MRTSAAALGLLMLSCFQPELISGRYRCDRPEDTCPRDFICHSGLCVDPTLAGDGGALDLRVPGSEDLRGQEPKGDMSPPAMDMRTGCTVVSKDKMKYALACPLTFMDGPPATACPTGYSLCGTGDDALVEKVEWGEPGTTKCSTLGGFYAASLQAAVKIDKANEVVCESSNEEGGWALVGCGSEPGLGAEPVTRVVTNECKKLKVMLPCREAATSWSCTQQLSDASHSDKHPGGVLCCKN